MIFFTLLVGIKISNKSKLFFYKIYIINLITMKKILVIHTKYRITGGEDIAVESEVSTLKEKFHVETLFFSNKQLGNYLLI